MTTPGRPDAAPPDPAPALSDVIDIRHWLGRQSGRIPTTPSDLVDWLHELIATAAADPELTRLARLAHAEQHLRRFGALLDTTVNDRWAAQDLHGEELFERYAHDERFRTELHAVAGIAAYTATRADTALPPDAYLAAAVIPTRRQQVLIKAIEDHAPRYHATIGSPARYIAEAHVPGGATRAEWSWISYYIAAHTDVLTGPVLSIADVDARNRALADQHDQQALTAFKAGDHQRALDLIDEAQLCDPRRDWDALRAYVRHRMRPATPAAAEPSTPASTRPDASVAGAAFARDRSAPADRGQLPSAPPPAAPVRGSHR